jgi:hypothetical protein
VTRRLKQIGSAALLVIAFCVAREMAVFTLDLPFKVTPSVTSKGTSPSGGTPGTFACRITAPKSAVGEAMRDAIKCGSTSSSARQLDITLDGDLDDPFCFTPLFKTGSIAFHLTVREGDKTHVDYQFTYGLRVVGMVSCRSFRRKLGRYAGQAVDRLLHTIP